MKTLLLALGFPPDIGGIETILYQTARRLSTPVIVVRPGRERRYSVDSQNGLEIHSLPSVKWNLLLNLKAAEDGFHCSPTHVGFATKIGQSSVAHK